MKKKLFFIHSLFGLACLVGPTPGLAEVYRCDTLNGNIEFRDSPCVSPLEKQALLPYVYPKTSEKVIRQEEREIKALTKRLAADEKKAKQAQNKREKQAEKAELKEKRLALKCERTQEKIRTIETELRRGCKIRRCNRLKDQLIHHQTMAKRNCVMG